MCHCQCKCHRRSVGVACCTFHFAYNFQQFISFAVARYNTIHTWCTWYNLPHAKTRYSARIVSPRKVTRYLVPGSNLGIFVFLLSIVSQVSRLLFTRFTLPGLLPFPLLFACLFTSSSTVLLILRLLTEHGDYLKLCPQTKLHAS